MMNESSGSYYGGHTLEKIRDQQKLISLSEAKMIGKGNNGDKVCKYMKHQVSF